MTTGIPDIHVFEETEEPVVIEVGVPGPQGPPGFSRFLEAEDVTEEGLVHGAVFYWDEESGVLRPANMAIDLEALEPLAQPMPRISGESDLTEGNLNAVAIEIERRLGLLTTLLSTAFRPLSSRRPAQS
jgi:hypothetical protein